MTEEWKEIAGVPGYSVSDQGRIRNDKTGCVLKPHRSAGNTMQVPVRPHRKPVIVTLPRAVALAFIGPPPHPLNRVAYRDGDKSNVRADNLFWMPLAAINAPSAVRQKLTPGQAREIRDSYARGGVTQRQLADAYGVSIGTICPLINGKTWKEYFDVAPGTEYEQANP
jgi:hypothetical protein